MLDLLILCIAVFVYLVLARKSIWDKEFAYVSLSLGVSLLAVYLLVILLKLPVWFSLYGGVAGIVLALFSMYGQKIFKGKMSIIEEEERKYWKLTRALVPLLIVLSTLAITPLHAVSVTYTVNYNGAPITGTLYYYDGVSTKSAAISSGSVSADLPKLPCNVTIEYQGKYYVIVVKDASGTIDLAKVSKLTLTANATIPVKVTIENTKLNVDTPVTIYANTTTVVEYPTTVFYNFKLYSLKNLTTSGSVTVQNSNKAVATGSGSVTGNYEEYLLFGIPLTWIIIGVAVIFILLGIGLAMKKSIVKSVSDRGFNDYWRVKNVERTYTPYTQHSVLSMSKEEEKYWKVE